MQRVGNATATPGGWSSQGDTTESSAVISNVPDTTGLYVGDYISFNAGFDETLGSRLRVVSLTLTTITVDRAANATEASIAIASLANMYTDGVVDTVARTVLNSKYMNLLQEEIVNAVVEGGLDLDEADTMQLSKVIQARLSLAGGTMAGNISMGHNNVLRSELVINSWGDLTYILAGGYVKYYKCTVDAAVFNTLRISLATDDPDHLDGKPWILKLNLNGGAVGQEFMIINDGGPYVWEKHHIKPYGYNWSKNIQIQSRWFDDPNKKAIFVQVRPKSSLSLRRLLASALPYTNPDRLGWFPGAGTSGHCWKIVSQSQDVWSWDDNYITEL